MTRPMISAAIVFALVASVGSAHAGGERGRGPGASSIVVTVNGVTCTTAAGASAFNARTWQWGAESTGGSSTGSGGGSGRTDVSAVTISKAFDGCSAGLFRTLARGVHIPEVTITQRDSDGTTTATLVLSEAFITSWFVSATTKNGSPDETVAFTYREICVTGEGSARVCYDVVRNVTT